MRSKFVVVVAMAAVLAVACGDDSGAPGDAAASEDGWTQQGGPVVLTRVPFFSDAATAIAEAEGYYERFGVEVRFEETRSASQMIPSQVTGQVDVIHTGTDPGLFTVVADEPGVSLVATGSVLAPDGCDHLSMLVLPETLETISFEDPESLRGVRIGAPFRSISVLRYLEEAVGSWGLSLDDVEVVDLDRSGLAAALTQGDIDLAISQEPASSIMQESGAVVTNPAHRIVPNQVQSAISFGPRLLDDRELGARVLAAYLLGEQQYLEGPTERNIEIISVSTEIDPALMEGMCWATLDSDAAELEDEITALLEWARERGDLERVPSPDEVWDHSFRERALELIEAEGLELGRGSQ